MGARGFGLPRDSGGRRSSRKCSATALAFGVLVGPPRGGKTKANLPGPCRAGQPALKKPHVVFRPSTGLYPGGPPGRAGRAAVGIDQGAAGGKGPASGGVGASGSNATGSQGRRGASATPHVPGPPNKNHPARNAGGTGMLGSGRAWAGCWGLGRLGRLCEPSNRPGVHFLVAPDVFPGLQGPTAFGVGPADTWLLIRRIREGVHPPPARPGRRTPPPPQSTAVGDVRNRVPYSRGGSGLVTVQGWRGRIPWVNGRGQALMRPADPGRGGHGCGPIIDFNRADHSGGPPSGLVVGPPCLSSAGRPNSAPGSPGFGFGRRTG